MQLSKITALLLGSVIAFSPAHALSATKQKTKTVTVQPKSTAKAKTATTPSSSKNKSTPASQKPAKGKGAEAKAGTKKVNGKASATKSAKPKAAEAKTTKAKNSKTTAKSVTSTAKKAPNKPTLTAKNSVKKPPQKSAAKNSKSKKNVTKVAKNETKKLYGVKGAKLKHVKVSDKKYSYREKGKTYTSIGKEPSRMFSQTGAASYYGSQFHGQRTASGEAFNKNAYTAAHKTLALGSYALVTNLRNGRKVIVRINDRGPFSHSRVLDLSVAAARELGMLNTGVARVKVEAMQVDRQGYISGKGAESLYKLAKREGLHLKVKGEGKNLAIKAE